MVEIDLSEPGMTFEKCLLIFTCYLELLQDYITSYEVMPDKDIKRAKQSITDLKEWTIVNDDARAEINDLIDIMEEQLAIQHTFKIEKEKLWLKEGRHWIKGKPLLKGSAGIP